MTEKMASLTIPAFNVEQMREAAGRATTMLRVLSNEDRLLLLCQLTQGEVCVSDLEELLGIRQPTLSQQLGILRNEEIVSTRREGKKIFYQISDMQVVSVLNTLYGLYCPAPASIKLASR
jgi:DNA-binding transcriptional ArsR family regulator